MKQASTSNDRLHFLNQKLMADLKVIQSLMSYYNIPSTVPKDNK